MTTPPSNNRSTPAQFRSKLGTYLLGVAIGFMILGSIYYQKHLATQRVRASQSAQQQPLDTTEPTP